jgi:phosphosulfolactate phosphohydrolase-like enzyme
MPENATVKIDAFPDSAFRYLERDAIVCVDVISSTTTIVTAVAQGRLAFPAANADEALRLSSCLTDSLLAVECVGDPQVRFEMQNQPAALAQRQDVRRPLVLAGLFGTQLIVNTAGARAAYVACYRNISATVEYLAAHHRGVVVLGAGFGHEVRCEDQMAAARIAAGLLEFGFQCEDSGTADLVGRWAAADLAITALGKSAAYLRRLGHGEDLDFVLKHVDDLDLVCKYDEGAVKAVPTSPPLLREALSAALGRPAEHPFDSEERRNVVPFGAPSRVSGSAFSKA